jgi:hypothetical protein
MIIIMPTSSAEKVRATGAVSRPGCKPVDNRLGILRRSANAAGPRLASQLARSKKWN